MHIRSARRTTAAALGLTLLLRGLAVVGIGAGPRAAVHHRVQACACMRDEQALAVFVDTGCHQEQQWQPAWRGARAVARTHACTHARLHAHQLCSQGPSCRRRPPSRRRGRRGCWGLHCPPFAPPRPCVHQRPAEEGGRRACVRACCAGASGLCAAANGCAESAGSGASRGNGDLGQTLVLARRALTPCIQLSAGQPAWDGMGCLDGFNLRNPGRASTARSAARAGGLRGPSAVVASVPINRPLPTPKLPSMQNADELQMLMLSTQPQQIVERAMHMHLPSCARSWTPRGPCAQGAQPLSARGPAASC